MQALTAILFGAALLGPFAVWAQCPTQCRCGDTSIGKTAKCTGLVEVFPPGRHDTFRILDVSFNDIAILEDRVFYDKQLEELIQLNMSHNRIERISVNAFQLMAEIKILDLSHNELTTIGPSVFTPLSKSLEELYLNNNPLLTLSDRFVFTALTQLDLSECNQKSLPDRFLSDLKTLVDLNLAGNTIENIDRNILEASELNFLSSLNLRRNNITALHSQLLRFRNSVKIDVTENPWVCDCDFINLIPLYEQRPFRPALVCATPLNLKGRQASTMLAEEMKCDSGSSGVHANLLAVVTLATVALSLLTR